jgi:1-acyl-sn-glycerol-3-phosphate acyltransferase
MEWAASNVLAPVTTDAARADETRTKHRDTDVRRILAAAVTEHCRDAPEGPASCRTALTGLALAVYLNRVNAPRQSLRRVAGCGKNTMPQAKLTEAACSVVEARATDPAEQSPGSGAGAARPARAARKRPRVATDALARASARAEAAIRRVSADQPAGEHESAPAQGGAAPDVGVSAGSAAPSAKHRERRRAGKEAHDAGATGLTGLLQGLVSADLNPDDPGSRDPEFVRAAAPFFDFLWSHYFRAEVEGAEHVPPSGPVIVVGNHSGGALVTDVVLKLACWGRHFGTQQAARALVHDGPFDAPVLRNLLLKLGALRATPENARRSLAQGGPVLIYPGGDVDGAREPNKIDFLGRTAFIELAFEHGIPILPIVNVGADEVSLAHLTGRALRRWTGIEAFARAKNMSLPLGLPRGMWIFGLLPYLPLPSKIVYKVGKPIWCAGGAARLEDPAVVRRVYRRLTRVMQQMVDDLASRRRLPVIG